MIMIISPEVVNATPSSVTRGTEVISLLTMSRTSTVLSIILAMTLATLPSVPPLTHLFTKEST